MSQNLINRYRKSLRLQFQNPEIEARYRVKEGVQGRNSATVGFATLMILTLTYAYLEFKAFGHDVATPMYGYLLAAVFALVNLALCQFNISPQTLKVRLLANALLAFGSVVGAVFLQEYIAYHAIEFILLAIWLGSTKSLRTVISFGMNLIFAVAFIGAMYATEISEFRISLVLVVLPVAVLLAACLGYLMERSQRLMFLQADVNQSMTNRQELWAFTLIDLDMALSGILDFKEMIAMLKKHLEPVIVFESYVMTSLEGQGPKPVADKVEGELFENDDRTIWSEDLLGKLTQTRQATTSAEHETVTGFLGMKRDRFISYRLDVPVFNDSKLLGVISLRRSDEPFDDLDMIASVSIAAQAMLIFKRTQRSSVVGVDRSVPDPVIRPRGESMQAATNITKALSSESRDLEVTDNSFDPDGTLVPREVREKFKQEAESVKRTITLMSRENADKVAVERYRTAAIEGEPLSILIIEVDGLSKLREQDGDQVAYKVFAAIVKYIFTMVDKDKYILGRYGQNGLSVLMPTVDMNAAEKFAESIRQFVANARYKTAYGEKSATLSIGVAAITDDTGDYPSMVKRADMALFVAKKNGRNCVKVRL